MMNVDLNITYITLDGYIEVHRYRYLYFFIMCTVYIIILCFNCAIVFIIVSHRSLHEPMYIFIAALLLNSVMFSAVVYPKLLIDLLSERQIISVSACFFQSFIYYSLGGAEFLLLTVMAYDRYVSICKPLQYLIIMKKKTVGTLLGLAWILPAFHLSVFEFVLLYLNSELCDFTLRGIFCKSPLYNLLCVQSEAHVIMPTIILINVALLPVLLILFSYIQIVRILYQSCAKVRSKAAETCLPHLLVLISFSCLCASDVIMSLVSDISKILNFIISFQIVTYQPLLNPVIYGLKMKELSKHLKRLFCRDRSE